MGRDGWCCWPPRPLPEWLPDRLRVSTLARQLISPPLECPTRAGAIPDPFARGDDAPDDLCRQLAPHVAAPPDKRQVARLFRGAGAEASDGGRKPSAQCRRRACQVGTGFKALSTSQPDPRPAGNWLFPAVSEMIVSAEGPAADDRRKVCRRMLKYFIDGRRCREEAAAKSGCSGPAAPPSPHPVRRLWRSGRAAGPRRPGGVGGLAAQVSVFWARLVHS